VGPEGAVQARALQRERWAGGWVGGGACNGVAMGTRLAACTEASSRWLLDKAAAEPTRKTPPTRIPANPTPPPPTPPRQLLNWNCNHFTSEMAQLLTGEDIPGFVRDQAKEVMDTPLGRQFAPMILQLEGITSQAHAAGFGAPPAAAAAAAPAAVASKSDGSAGATQRANAANVTATTAAGGGGAAAASTAGVRAAAAAGAAAASRAAAAAAGGSGGAGTAAGGSDLVQGVSSLKIEGDGGDESQVAGGAAGASSAS